MALRRGKSSEVSRFVHPDKNKRTTRNLGRKEGTVTLATHTASDLRSEGYVYKHVGGKGGDMQWVRPSAKPKKTSSPSPADTLATITNEDMQIFEEDFVPVMEGIIDEITDEQGPNKEAEKARERALKAHAREKEIFERSLKRTGTKADGRQRRKIEKQFGLSRARSSVNAANLARRGKEDENLQALQGQIEAGQSLRGNALQGLGAAAGLEARRDMLGQQLARQNESSFFSNVGTGAGIGMSVGGPVGALVGGVAGGVLSIFD